MYFILNKFDNPFVKVIKFGFLFFLSLCWSLNWKLGHFCITFLLITSIYFPAFTYSFYSYLFKIFNTTFLWFFSSFLICSQFLSLPISAILSISPRLTFGVPLLSLLLSPSYYFPLSYFLFLYSFLQLDLFLTSFLFLFSFHWSYITLHYLIALHIFPTSQNSLATAPPSSLSSLPLALLLLLLLLPACLCAIFFNVCFVDWL